MSRVLEAVEASLIELFGHQPQRASVSFVGVDPIEVLRFEPIPGDRAYVSLGMSRRPMTGAAESSRAADGPRAELVLSLHDPTDQHADVWRHLALLAAAPAVEGVVYVPDMTTDLGTSISAGSLCTGVLVADSSIPNVDTDAGPVSILQAVPATATELAWARVRGSAALRARWVRSGIDQLDLGRRPVGLD